MKEYIQHEVNGLLFKHRDSASLAIQMKRLLDEPDLCKRITKRGYLQSDDGHIPDIQEHTRHIVELYDQIVKKKRNRLHDGETRSMAHHI